MRILITGASGFVGRHLIRHLLQVTPDADVVGTTHREPVPDADAFDLDFPLRLVPCDITAAGGEDLRRLIAKEAPHHVYHLAGMASGAATDRAAVFSANVLGTQHLMQALTQEVPLARCLFVSTGYVYGPCDAAHPAREDDRLRPHGAYAESKRDAERYARDGGAVVARAFNHTGPGQTAAFAVPAFANQIAQIEAGCRPPHIQVGNLEAQRDFLDVRDVVRAYHALLNEGHPAEVYNVCRGEAYSLEAILSDLLALSPGTISVISDPQRLRPSDIPISVGDTSKLTSRTGWSPALSLSRTLQDTLDWWRAEVKNDNLKTDKAEKPA